MRLLAQAMEGVRFRRSRRSAGDAGSAVSAKPKKRSRNAVARAHGMPFGACVLETGPLLRSGGPYVISTIKANL